jgi:hypothetical protein
MSRNRTRLLVSLAAGCLSSIALIAAPSGAAAKDGNNDRIPDRWEKAHHLSLQVKQTRRDQDRDGLRNRGEFLSGHDPRDKDSDNDGVEDGDENAGRIASFDASTGRLVIDLFGGDSLSGFVNSSTEIKCEDEHENEVEHEHPGGHERHGGNSGPGGSDESGDDNSAPGSDDNSGPGHDGNGDERNCTTADLTVGRLVEEADLETQGGNAVFDEVELR